MTATAFPLAWPAGWPRTPGAKRVDARSRFAHTRRGERSAWTFAEARDELQAQLDRIGASNLVLSTNYELTLSGVPRKTAGVEDTGIAVYFTLKGRQMVMAQDAFTRAEENMRSLALALDAMRTLERHGGGVMMEKAFDGFAALPAPDGLNWRATLGYHPHDNPTAENVRARHRQLAQSVQSVDGGEVSLSSINAARDAALKEIGG